MSTLIKGSRGQNVKDLQKMLIDNGYLGKEYSTGFFGDLTQTALQKFQKERGLPVSGSFDDVTSNALKSVAGSDLIDNHPNIIGTPLGDYMKELKTSNPGLYYTLANAAQNGVMFTPGMVKAAQSQAESALNPYYEQDAQNSGGILQNYLDTTLSKYAGDVEDTQMSAAADFEKLNDAEGRNGTWSSNARNSRMNSLESTYNNKFADLYNTNKGNIADRLQSQEYNYGAGATPNTQLGSTVANFGSNTPSFASTSAGVYNPFNFAGRKKAEQASNVDAFTKQGLSSQFYPLGVKTNN